MKGHVTIHVPEGHEVQVHLAHVEPQMAPQSGMIHDPAMSGALAAMTAALPTPEQRPVKQDRGGAQPAPAVQPARKKPMAAKKKAAKKPAEKESKKEDAGEAGEE